MHRRPKLKVVVTVVSAVAAFFGLAGIPAAQAASCSVLVTLPSGQQLSFQLPSGAPLSDLQLTTPSAKIQETCPSGADTVTTTTTVTAPGGTTTTTTTTTTTATGTTSTTTTETASGTSTTSTTSSSPSTTSTSTTSSTTTTTTTGTTSTPPPTTTPPPQTTAPGSAQPSSHHKPKLKKPKKPKKPKPKKPKPKKPGTKPPPPANGGVPNPSNPTYSFALPGAAPIGVPNFFIDSFRIPPFLIPIYQAAGIQYDVPWQVLAAINEIETDYGRNLSVSSAGAVGWMQFLPSTWKAWGVDANGDGVADPYNPVDAIFSAARYLNAAGASKNVADAIYAYNHAWWYVQSVLLRAKLIGGIPDKLIGALTGLVEGHFPVAARAAYADDAIVKLAHKRVTSGNAAILVDSDPSATGVRIFAKRSAPVIAVNDGKVIAMGRNARFGRYLELQDATGNVYVYADLGSIPARYPVPKPVRVTAAQIAKQLSAPIAGAPKSPASAGQQLPPATAGQQSTTGGTATAGGQGARPGSGPGRQPSHSGKSGHVSLPQTHAPAAPPITIPKPLVKERLFAHPSRPASFAAGGALQMKESAPQIASFQDYFSSVLHLGKNQYTLQPLKPGAIVVAGTILGRIGAGTRQLSSHLEFMLRPAGKNSPFIDPKPILDGWKLLEATAVYRAAGIDPFFGPGAKNPTIGQVLLMSKEQLTVRVLQDPHVQIYACGRRDIQAGLIDRRILAVIEFLSASGLYPTVSGLECGHSLTASTGVDAAGVTGSSMDISRINNIPIEGHQGAGSIADIAIRRLLTLQGALAPDEIVSLMSYRGQATTLALPDHGNRVQIAYTPLFGQNKKLSAEVTNILKPGQWIQLINRIGQIPEPIVPIAPSRYAIKTSP